MNGTRAFSGNQLLQMQASIAVTAVVVAAVKVFLI